jgi:osmotically-inducible protein OsmY
LGRDYGRSYGETGFGSGTTGGYGQGWSGRSYQEAYPRRGGEERGWWDRARDEVYSWMGDEGAEQRRREDEMRGHHGRGPKGYTRSDERIREDVSDQLTDDWLVDASNIEVSVKDCEVILSGTVDSRAAKRRAEDCAERVSGVRNVQNNIRVQQPTESTSAFGSGSTTGAGFGTTGTGTAGSSKTNK